MERINIEDARIRVEFRKNETNEVIKSEWFDVVSYFCSSDFEHEMSELLKESGSDYYKIVEFEDIPKELQLSDRLPDETIALCNYFCTREDDEKELKYLKKKRNIAQLGYREIDIISNSGENDFIFRGLYDNGTLYHSFIPYYWLNNMAYLHMNEISIVG